MTTQHIALQHADGTRAIVPGNTGDATIGRHAIIATGSLHPDRFPEVPAVIWLVAVAALLLGFNKAGFAGTLGPFVTVIMVLAMPADQAVGLLLPMLIAADSFSVAAYWRQWETKLLWPLLAAAAVGIAAGTFVISHISEDALRRLIAIALLLFAVIYVKQRGVRIPQHHHRQWAMVAGTTAGFTSSIAHAGGPPIIVYLMGVGLEPKRFVGTTVALFAMINLLKVPGYLLAGLIDGHLILTTIWGWLLIPVGVALGRLLIGRIDRTRFERITFGLLVVGALALLVF